MNKMLKRLFVALMTALAFGYVFSLVVTGGASWNVFPQNFLAIAVYMELLVIAFFVAIVGIVTVHPVFGFPMFILRGIAVGALVAFVYALGMASILYAVGVARIEWLPHIAVGATAGLVIDIVATWVAGHGHTLLHKKNA